MGKYRIKITDSARKEISKIKKSGQKSLIKKLDLFFKEISDDPRNGIGKPEQLKYYDGEVWSRRLSKKDRFFSEISENQISVIVIQTLGHYFDS